MFTDNELQHNKVEVIMGAEYVKMCLEGESVNEKLLKLRNSKFGHVAPGTAKSSLLNFVESRFCNLSTITIDDILRKFWKIEQIFSQDKVFSD